MNYSDLVTMVVLVVVPAIAAWWWIQKSNGKNGVRSGPVTPSDAGAAKRDAPK